MAHQIKGRRAIGQQDIAIEAGEIRPVILEAVDMAQPAIADQPLRAALAAPVESGDGKAAPAEIGDGLEIFLDEFGAPLHEADRAAMRAFRFRPQRKAQSYLVAGGEEPHSRTLWNRIGRNADQAWSTRIDFVHVPARIPMGPSLPGSSGQSSRVHHVIPAQAGISVTSTDPASSAQKFKKGKPASRAEIPASVCGPCGGRGDGTALGCDEACLSTCPFLVPPA